MQGTSDLVTLKTRVSSSTVDELGRIARKNERSLAAELRIAIANHIETDASGKDGRK